MGLYDRDYTQADSRRQHYGPPQMHFNLPRITPVVKWLLIANIGVHILQVMLFPAQMRNAGLLTPIEQIFAVNPITVGRALQLWRLVSYQFLHGSAMHLFLNMLGLFFFGPTLERHWGSKRFIAFYLLCGVVGGLSYYFLALVHLVSVGTLVGASGAILGVLAACAILFPDFIVIILLFPVPIRVAAVVMLLFSVVNILMGGSNAGGDAAHLGGMAAGAAYVLLFPRLKKYRLKTRSGSWEKQMEQRRLLQVEVDRILAKVHQSGLHSLTAKEKRILKKATQEELKRQNI
jgi:membrane associated rhomboid family serine protease